MMQKAALCTCNIQTLSIKLTVYATRTFSQCDVLWQYRLQVINFFHPLISCLPLVLHIDNSDHKQPETETSIKLLGFFLQLIIVVMRISVQCIFTYINRYIYMCMRFSSPTALPLCLQYLWEEETQMMQVSCKKLHAHTVIL